MRSLKVVATLIEILISLAIRTKRKGERRSHYRMPMEGEKEVEGDPLTEIEKKVEEVKAIIQLV